MSEQRILFTPRKCLFLLSLIPLLITGCNRASKQVVARVGDYTIFQSDIDYRVEIGKVFYPKEFSSRPKKESDEIGLKQLMDAYTHAQILKNNGKDMSEATLKSESDRIDRESRDSTTLGKIKRIFGRDIQAYYKVFVLPTLADRMIFYGFFLVDPKIQEESVKEPGGMIRAVNELHIPYDDIVKKNKLKKSKLYVSEKNGVQTEADRKKKPTKEKNKLIDLSQTPGHAQHLRLEMERQNKSTSEALTKFYLHNVVTQTKPGKLFHSPVDRQTHWEVIRYIGRGNGPEQLFEIINFPKLDYGVWIENEKKKFTIVRALSSK